jgi:hypothetical protein
MRDSLGKYQLNLRINLGPRKPVSQITDRAKRYRAQQNVKGPKRCVFCGSTKDLGVSHLDGNESNGEPSNLAWVCRRHNAILGHAFKRIGAGVRTRQYNPPKVKGVPTFSQYAWAVSQQRHSGEHGEPGSIIHATPRHKRIEYARRIAELKGQRRGEVPF